MKGVVNPKWFVFCFKPGVGSSSMSSYRPFDPLINPSGGLIYRGVYGPVGSHTHLSLSSFGNQTNLQANVSFAPAYASGPPLIHSDLPADRGQARAIAAVRLIWGGMIG